MTIKIGSVALRSQGIAYLCLCLVLLLLLGQGFSGHSEPRSRDLKEYYCTSKVARMKNYWICFVIHVHSARSLPSGCTLC